MVLSVESYNQAHLLYMLIFVALALAAYLYSIRTARDLDQFSRFSTFFLRAIALYSLARAIYHAAA